MAARPAAGRDLQVLGDPPQIVSRIAEIPKEYVAVAMRAVFEQFSKTPVFSCAQHEAWARTELADELRQWWKETLPESGGEPEQ